MTKLGKRWALLLAAASLNCTKSRPDSSVPYFEALDPKRVAIIAGDRASREDLGLTMACRGLSSVVLSSSSAQSLVDTMQALTDQKELVVVAEGASAHRVAYGALAARFPVPGASALDLPERSILLLSLTSGDPASRHHLDEIIRQSAGLELAPEPPPSRLPHQLLSVTRAAVEPHLIEYQLEELGLGPLRPSVWLEREVAGFKAGQFVPLDLIDGPEVVAPNAACSDPHLLQATRMVGREVTPQAQGPCGLGRLVDGTTSIPQLERLPDWVLSYYGQNAPIRGDRATFSREALRLLATRSRALVPPVPRESTQTTPGPVPEDTSIVLRELHVNGYRGAVESALARDLLHVAQREGFTVVTNAVQGQDPGELAAKIIREAGLSSGSHLEVRPVNLGRDALHGFSEDTKVALRESGTDALLGIPRLSEQTLTDFQQVIRNQPHFRAFEGRQGGAVGFAGEAEEQARASQGKIMGRTAKTYLEGGNVLIGTALDGMPYAVVGYESVILSALHAERERRWPTPLPVALPVPNVVDMYGSELKALGYERIEEKLALVATWIAEELLLPRARVIFVPQPGFHLDMYVLVLHPGQVLVHSYLESDQMIANALTRSASLAPGDARWLMRMQTYGREVAKIMQPVSDEIAAILKNSPLQLSVVRSPGVFSSGARGSRLPCSRVDRLVANFLNAVPGTGLDGRNYVISNASSLWVLEDSMRAYFEGLGVSRVYFIGGARPGPNLRTFAEEGLALHDGGVNCAEVHFGQTPRVGR